MINKELLEQVKNLNLNNIIIAKQKLNILSNLAFAGMTEDPLAKNIFLCGLGSICIASFLIVNPITITYLSIEVIEQIITTSIISGTIGILTGLIKGIKSRTTRNHENVLNAISK